MIYNTEQFNLNISEDILKNKLVYLHKNVSGKYEVLCFKHFNFFFTFLLN